MYEALSYYLKLHIKGFSRRRLSSLALKLIVYEALSYEALSYYLKLHIKGFSRRRLSSLALNSLLALNTRQYLYFCTSKATVSPVTVSRPLIPVRFCTFDSSMCTFVLVKQVNRVPQHAARCCCTKAVCVPLY